MGWIRLSLPACGVERKCRARHESAASLQTTLPLAIFANTEINFARDLQDHLGILALLALSAPFRICKLQIPLVRRETDPASGYHLESITYKSIDRSLLFRRLLCILSKYRIFNNMIISDDGRVLVVQGFQSSRNSLSPLECAR
jgi:hypothetical protein